MCPFSSTEYVLSCHKPFCTSNPLYSATPIIHSPLCAANQLEAAAFPLVIKSQFQQMLSLPRLLLLWPLISHLLALESPPALECLENAMRLHFVPDQQPEENGNGEGRRPFGGHVYVKGFFFSAHCHLDYGRAPISLPFFMHIPYRSECQVKRERATGQPGEAQENGQQQQPANGVAYTVVVIVQHHRLFVTNRDKAYSISCFYRDAQREFERRLEVGDLATADLAGQREAPTCQYEVLREGEGTEAQPQAEPVRFANIGELLVHRWTCDTQDMGMLVHSCTVRDGLGHSFALLDQRGCVNDASLMPALSYGPELNSSSVAISAFKFADQMVVYFRCQITLCDKRDNGCEGITPPVCQLVPLPSEGGPPVPVLEASRDLARRIPTPIRQKARNPVAPTVGCCRQNLWQPLPILFGHGRTAAAKISSSRERRQMPMPQQSRGRMNTNNRTSSMAGGKKRQLITLDVAADGLLVFTRDEGPSVEERGRLMAQLERLPSSSHQCPNWPNPLWALCGLAFLPLLTLALVLQRHLLHRRFKAHNSFSPGYPVQLSDFPSAFGVQSPIPKPRHYGRL